MTEGGQIGEIQPYIFEPHVVIMQCPKVPSDSWVPTVHPCNPIPEWLKMDRWIFSCKLYRLLLEIAIGHYIRDIIYIILALTSLHTFYYHNFSLKQTFVLQKTAEQNGLVMTRHFSQFCVSCFLAQGMFFQQNKCLEWIQNHNKTPSSTPNMLLIEDLFWCILTCIVKSMGPHF